MVSVRNEGHLQLEGGPVMVPFLFFKGDDRCDTSVASATCVSHAVPENCRERGF